MDLEEVMQRHDTAHKQISNVAPQYRRELLQMSQNADKARAEISKELINCRRTGRPSLRFKELVAQLEQIVDTMEQYITLGSLLT